MYIYRTSSFDEQATEKGIKEHIDRLCEELESMSSEQVLSRFERVYPYLKRKEHNLRLIARVRRVGNEPVLCWLKVFRRGDREYEEFLRDRQSFGDRHLENQIKEPHLLTWLQQQKSNLDRVVTTPQPLQDELRLWLERPSLRMDFNGMVIYESEVWLTQFATPTIQGRWTTYNRLIAQLVQSQVELGQETPWPGISLYNQENCYILYTRLQTSDTPSRKILFLLSPFFNPPTLDTLAATLRVIVGSNDDHFLPLSPPVGITLDELTIIARRGYPSYLLADETNWLAIENEEQANLALSAEEEAILHTVSTAKPSLPLFLNGQAGSGKSTMLFHLFADYCHKHLQFCEEQNRPILEKPHPLFLAYSDRLLKVAKERVIPLLASHHRFLEKRGSSGLPEIGPFFQTFRTFLQHLLPLEERDRFNDANHISFHHFRQLLTRTNWLKHSPEKCWQAIQTFIKGYHLDERDTYLDVDDYREIPKKEGTVTVEEFAEIYHTVWKWYERYTKEENKWDDRDLVRRVLQLKCYRSEYTAIFCDEAQDFSQLELQLIMRLSIFFRYDLEHHYVESLPFAFAGDPLQTLNPTGFRWASLKAAFYNEVISTLSPTGKLGLEMNFAELECNYRSLSSIVGVINLIQLWRSVLFDLPELKPQRARKTGDFIPQKLILNEEISPTEIRERLQDTIVIIPCDRGGEADYIQKDEILSSLPASSKDGVPWNILSAITAKGLEFKQVVLYKFGEACNLRNWEERETLQAEVQYFFNKLYVAASRATERLFIIDTEAGEQRLWSHGNTREELEKFLARATNSQEWRDRIQLIGSSGNAKVISADDLLAIAQALATEGINSENADLISRAQEAYQRLGDHHQVQLAQAYSLKFTEQFEEAGELFLQLEDFREAWDCFWRGLCWFRLNSWYEQNEELDPVCSYPEGAMLVQPLVKFMNETEANFKTVYQFSQWLDRELDKNGLESYRFTRQLQASLDTYSARIKVLIEQEEKATTEEWEYLGNLLQKLAKAKYRGMGEAAGGCFYRAQNWEAAIACWDNSNYQKSPAYAIAKAEQLGIPEGLPHLLKAQQFSRIITAWGEANSPQTPEWLKVVPQALEATQQWLRAIELYTEIGATDRIASCLEKALQQPGEIKVIKPILEIYVRGNHWELAIDAIERLLPQLISKEIIFFFVHQLAHSSLTPETLPKNVRRRYQHLIKEGILLQPRTDWEKHLSVPELGIALEKIGALVETLEFYESYTQKGSPSLLEFVRRRWLATKKKQEIYLNQQGNIRKALKSQDELHKKAQLWEISLTTLSLPIPSPPELAIETQEPSPAIGEPISGLPSEITITSPQPELLSFQVRHLGFKVMVNLGQVLIEDHLTGKTVRIDTFSHQITLDTTIIQYQPSEPLTISDNSLGYHAILSFGSEVNRLELTVQSLSQPFSIYL